MSVIFVVLPLALVLGGFALWACVRAIQSGQYDDLDTPAVRALLDDEPAPDRAPAGPARPGVEAPTAGEAGA